MRSWLLVLSLEIHHWGRWMIGPDGDWVEMLEGRRAPSVERRRCESRRTDLDLECTSGLCSCEGKEVFLISHSAANIVLIQKHKDWLCPVTEGRNSGRDTIYCFISVLLHIKNVNRVFIYWFLLSGENLGWSLLGVATSISGVHAAAMFRAWFTSRILLGVKV